MLLVDRCVYLSPGIDEASTLTNDDICKQIFSEYSQPSSLMLSTEAHNDAFNAYS